MSKAPANGASPEAGKSRAADDLARIFIDMINAGILKEGAPLPPEREIVETYGMSRTVVREAILSLANKGLVEARPRFRPVVRKPNYDTALGTLKDIVGRLLVQPDGVKNLFDTRILVEAILVRQAAMDAGKEDIAALKEALEANEAAIEDSDLFYETDMAFHQVLYQISRNPVLPAIHRAYTTWLAPHWSRMPRMADRNRNNFLAHKAIYEAILLRDPDAAEKALRTHLSHAWDQVQATFT